MLLYLTIYFLISTINGSLYDDGQGPLDLSGFGYYLGP